MRTYGSVELTKKGWEITALEPHVCGRLKDMFTFVARRTSVPFRIRNSPDLCRDLLWFTQRYPLEISEADAQALRDGAAAYDRRNDELEAIQRPDYVPRDVKLKIPLRPYQKQFVETFLKARRILCGDDVGLGKTATAIASWVAEPAMLPAVVVVQTHLPKQWKEQVEKFSDLRVHLVQGTKPYSLPPADVYVIKYSCLAGWVDTYRMGTFRSATFDEVQELRNRGSAKHAAGQALSESVGYCLGLSATPVYNYGNEAYNVLSLLSPGCLSDWEEFSREWVGGDGKRILDPKALGSYLRERFLMIRRTREETSQYLPPVNRVVHAVDYDHAAVESAEELARQLAIRTTTGTFVERGQAARELDIMVRHMTGVSKARYVAAYVRILLENGEPVLLAGWHRDVYDIWNKELADFKPVMYTGTESPAEKERSKAAFTSGEANLMIISLRSGVGLDGLQQRASVVVFGELDWSPAVHDQVIGRLRRDGQEKQVTALFLVSDTGSDPLMVDLCGLKSSQSQGILDPGAALGSVHSDDSRLKLLAERFLTKAPKGETIVP